MKLLVTGGNGFIGRHVVAEALRRGHAPLVLMRPATGPEAPPTIEKGVEIVRWDLREAAGLAEAIAGVDAAVHCAAVSGGGLESHLANTVDGTLHLLAAMQAAGVRRIVGISTFALYDYQRLATGSLLDETAPLEENLDARHPYIRAKRRQEELIRGHARENRWRWTILRPGIVFGRGRTWFHQLGVQLSPRLWVCLAGDSPLPLTYVGNCASAILDAVEAEAAQGSTLNIVDSESPARGDYMEAIALRTVPKPGIASVPWAVLDGTARTACWTNRVLLAERLRLPDLLEPASLHARCKPLRYSNERAMTLLGWRPRWSLEDAIAESFKDSG